MGRLFPEDADEETKRRIWEEYKAQKKKGSPPSRRESVGSSSSESNKHEDPPVQPRTSPPENNLPPGKASSSGKAWVVILAVLAAIVFSRLMGIPLALVLAIAVIFLSVNLVAEVRKLDKMDPEKTRLLLERDDLAAKNAFLEDALSTLQEEHDAFAKWKEARETGQEIEAAMFQTNGMDENGLASASAALEDLEAKYRAAKLEYDNLLYDLDKLQPEREILSYGLYVPHFKFDKPSKYRSNLMAVREEQKRMIQSGEAAPCSTTWTLNGDKRAGAKMSKQTTKLLLRAFNGECAVAVSSVAWNNIDRMESRIRKAFESINKMGAMSDVAISEGYLDLRLRELYLAFEYQEKLREEREEQRRIREQSRDEEKAQREFDRAIQEAAEKEAVIQKAMEKVRRAMEAASEEERARYEAKLQEMAEQLREAEARSQRAKSMAELTRCGHVYIISNIGSFGEDVYKIGLTRRLEPMERVQELGDASVPFPFDVHAMIYSEDAPALEKTLHRHFALGQVNKANYRKEFFRVRAQQLRDEIRALGIDAQWTLAAEAREYYETLSVEKAIAADPAAREAWLNRQLILEDIEEEAACEAEDLPTEAEKAAEVAV